MKLKAYRHRIVKYGPKNKPLDGNSPENKELSFSELSHLLRIMSIPMSMFHIVKIPVYLYTFIYMCFLRLSNTFKHASVCEFSKYLEFDVRICITSSNEMITSYIAKKHKKTKKCCCPLKFDFTSILWKCRTWHCLQKNQNIHMQALQSLIHIQEIKFKWNAPSSKDSVLSLCFLFSAMTSFSDHFWPKISKKKNF